MFGVKDDGRLWMICGKGIHMLHEEFLNEFIRIYVVFSYPAV